MDAQINLTLPNAQSIVSQLVDIAKTNNAMDVIGTSTGWRWQEGLISRMPKTRTVAAILTKAFSSENPMDWIRKVPDDLKWFIKANILKNKDWDDITSFEVDDIYETYFLTSWFGDQSLREEVVFGFCYFRYAKTIDNSIEEYVNPSSEKILSLFQGWAETKYDECVLKYDLGEVQRNSEGSWYQFINTESFTRYTAELAILRNKVVGFSSIFDMWKSSFFRVTDEEHIKIELEIKAFYDDLRSRYNSNKKTNQEISTKLRTYSFSAITLPSVGEVLK